MATIIAQSELVRRPFRFLCDKKRDEPDISLTILMDETAMRFNLGPREARELENLFRRETACRNEQTAG